MKVCEIDYRLARHAPNAGASERGAFKRRAAQIRAFDRDARLKFRDTEMHVLKLRQIEKRASTPRTVEISAWRLACERSGLLRRPSTNLSIATRTRRKSIDLRCLTIRLAVVRVRPERKIETVNGMCLEKIGEDLESTSPSY